MNLTLFDISKNNISDAGVNDIAAILSRNMNLQWLYLYGNNFESAGVKKIENSVQNIMTLREIHMSDDNCYEITQRVPCLSDDGQTFIWKQTLAITVDK